MSFKKSCRDVYDLLDQQWDMRVFNNIKGSEQRHMDMGILEIMKMILF